MSMSVPTAASISAMQAAMVSQQISIATLAKANDAMAAQGEAAIALLDSAVEMVDGQAGGSATRLDVKA